jgi:LysM repeat protein
MDKTGKRYNLEINEEIDERYHLQKATYAACAYFKEAYTQLKDWNLVAASYNMGIEGVKRQVKAQNVQNYYDLYLNVETARYLFRIIAIKDICENPNQFGFHIAPTDFYQPVPVVYVKTDLSISSLATWSNDNGCNYKLLKLLNPWLRKPFINVAPGMIYYIALPKNRMMQTASARSIKNDTLVLSNTNQNIQPNEDVFTEYTHIVLKSESIKSIAEKYKVSEEDIILWNELLNSSVLAPGSKIKIKKTGSDF